MREIDKSRLPAHIAIIMDGNGRWAKTRTLERVRGHERGADAVRTCVTACRELGVKALSLYAFSEENWRRPGLEVAALMKLLERYLIEERSEILDNNIRLVASGRIEKLPDKVRRLLEERMRESAANSGMFLNLCLSYTGHEEIVDAAVEIARRVQAGELQPADITDAVFARHLYVPQLPPVDLMIRTSGEMRVSGFLLWQIAYAELDFPEVYWPDFSKEHLYEAIRRFQTRERRFGLTGEQLAARQK